MIQTFEVLEGIMRLLVCTILCALVLVLAFNVYAGTGDQMLVRIFGNPADIHQRGLDVVGAKRFEWVDAIVDLGTYADLVSQGYRMEILIEDVEEHDRMVLGVYHTLQEVMDSLAAIATNHPGIARLDTLPYTTYEGRALVALKVSDNVGIEEDEPELLFDAMHHAREWPVVNIVLFAADTLTRAYGSDVHITEVVDSRQIWLMPVVNADGYFYSYDQNHQWWRKNRTWFPQYGTYGVDPNRNYGGSYNGSPIGEWGSTVGATSRHPDEDVYAGPGSMSEEEMKAVRYLVDQHDFVLNVSYHTYGEMVMWPWGYSDNVHVPDDALISAIGTEAASRITQQDGSGTYDAFQSAGPGMYPTSGGSDDWRYGYTYYHKGSNMLPFTTEACQSFHPNQSVLDQVCRENFDAIIYLCDVADSVKNLLVPYVLPPIVAPLDTISPPDFDIMWTQQNPLANAESYELQELSGLTVVTDSAEDGTSLWDMDGFTISSARRHDGLYSFYSTIGSPAAETVVAMTTRLPVPVMENDSFTFWYYCDIENLWDYGYAEVSVDGMEWEILEQFTGNKGWDRLAYSLENYVGGSIFIRFRYTVDQNVWGEGLYVDAISPLPDFDSVAIVSSSITDTFWSFVGKDPGEYWYRLKGYNTPRGWGHYGQLVHTQVAVGVAEKDARDLWSRQVLLQNRPNPFRTSTTISMVLPAGRGTHNLRIFDQAGRVVKSFALSDKGPLSASSGYSVVWDGTDDRGRDVPSGVYFYSVSSSMGTLTQKMVLAR